MKKFYFIGALLATCFTSNAQVVISQVYGGGGNGGSTYTHDFVELFNAGQTPVNINGWSIQYNSATGTGNWSNKTDLPNITLQPGKYYLVQEAQGAGGTTPLPTPDLIPTTPIAMGGTNLKILLANDGVVLTGANPTDASIMDKVGFGTATGFEGAAAPVLSNTTAGLRKNNGCLDSNNNSSDFEALAPTPRNSATAANICPPLSVTENNISGLKVYPNPAKTVLNVTSNSFEVKQVELYDVLGKLVLSTKVTNAPVNVSALSKGVYVVKVTEAGKSDTRKIVIE